MADQEQDSVHSSFHKEGRMVVFDMPPDPIEAARQIRENQQHEFQRSQVRANNRIATFTGILVFATFCTIGVGIWQSWISRSATKAATDSAKAAVKSNYLACIAAQATQVTLAQVEDSANYSRVAAAATVAQANSQMLAEQAKISFAMSFPELDQVFDNQIGIPFSIKNEGRSPAEEFSMKARGVLITPNDRLSLIPVKDIDVKGKFISPGGGYPGIPVNPKFRPITVEIPLHGKNGKVVLLNSQEGQDFLNGGTATTAFVYGAISYKDFFGVHNMRFCSPVYLMHKGDSRSTSVNDRKCGEYNSDTYERYGLPPIKDRASRDVAMQPLECPKPVD